MRILSNRLYNLFIVTFVIVSSLLSLPTQTLAATTGTVQLPSNVIADGIVVRHHERIVELFGQPYAVPAIIRGGTTYVAIWYVQNLIATDGIMSTWNGRAWHLFTAQPVDLTHVQPGKGSLQIFLDSTLVNNVSGFTATDPVTHKRTTFMQMWYLMHLLNRLGWQSTWNGLTWSITD